MKKMLVATTVVVLMSLASSALAEDEIGFEITSDVFSKYIWRGQLLNDDVVYQPGGSMTWGNMTFGIWGSLDTTDYADREWNFSEVDYYFDYSDALPFLEGVSYSVGVIYYDFPGTAADGSFVSDTTEIYWGIGFDEVPLTPTVTFYHDIDECEGTYVNLSLSHSYENLFEVADIPVGLELSAGFGYGSGSYNKYYWGIDSDKAQDFTFSLAMPFEIAGFSVSPSITYVALMSSDLRRTDTYNKDSDYFLTGISIAKSF
jgi:hypothetical protein